MGVIKGGKTIEGSMGTPLRNTGAPVNGTNEVQTLTGTGTAGTFTVSFRGRKTGAIAFNASAAAIAAALVALGTVGAGNVACAGGALGTNPVTVTFGGDLAGFNIDALVVDATNITGGTVTQATTTAGVNGTQRGAAVGALLIDTTNAQLYQNTGTPAKVTWTKVGTEA